jgi:hypothetical protein
VALTATTRLPLKFTLRTGANCAGAAADAADDDNLVALKGAAATDPETTDVTAAILNRMKNENQVLKSSCRNMM